jgi:hypothetical protein
MASDDAISGTEQAASQPEDNQGSNRGAGFGSFLETLNYLDEARGDKSLQIRVGDKNTTVCLKSSVLLALIFLILPFVGLGKYAAYCLSAADFFFAIALAAYIVGRFGILRAMSHRHALVCWQLMVGTCLMSVAISINVVFFIILLATVKY